MQQISNNDGLKSEQVGVMNNNLPLTIDYEGLGARPKTGIKPSIENTDVMPKEKEANKGGGHDDCLEVTINNQEKLKANSDVRDIVRLAGNTGKSVPKRVTGSVKIDKMSEEKAILAGGGEASLMGIKLKLRPTKFDMPPMPSKGLRGLYFCK